MKRPTATDIEVLFPGGTMISETDLRGTITFANRKFIQMTGYNLVELIGTPHAILRHPDMPKQAFKEMWNAIESNNEWNGCVKNLRKDGAFYWVHVYISPKFDPAGNKIGYIAGRKVPHLGVLDKTKALYYKLLSEEKADLSLKV
jgi:PAS domain S-box-containing protein